MYRILEPLETAKFKFKNRLIMPPMATQKCEKGGEMNDKIINYYRERAQGAYLSLIIIEHSYVDPAGQYRVILTSVSDDEKIPGMKKLAAAIQAEGVSTVMQLNHAGTTASSKITGLDVVGPSAVKSRVALGDDLPRPLTLAEIKTIISRFAEAARRVKAAGFDGVEIHSAHGYLLNQFYSPLSNHRADQYGGSFDNRIRVHLEIIEAVREVVGQDYPVFLRLGACDYMEGGNTIEDGVRAALAFEKAGVDVLDISGGLCSYQHPSNTNSGYFADASAAIKEAVSIPVILTGGIRDMHAAEQLLAENSADLIGVGRAIMKDPDWAKNNSALLSNVREKAAVPCD
ncbi:MAG: NADH:flavin oxidoreductase [Desulfotomaculaceae bacterium]|nr:NADH:flavin oxidoreductase [Desulfotomaculaceae bacterium]